MHLFITNTKKEKEYWNKIKKEAEQREPKRLRRWRIGLVLGIVGFLTLLFGLKISGVIGDAHSELFLLGLNLGLGITWIMTMYMVLLLKFSGRIDNINNKLEK